jgi:hypothetical protein
MPDFTFRQFQEELRKLDDAPPPSRVDGKKPSKKEFEAHRMARAKAEFLALRERHQWSVADVVAFFPEKEGLGYLMELLNRPAKKRGRKPKEGAET